MAEEFISQGGGLCSDSWWNSSRNAVLFAGGLSPCSAVAGDLASFCWPSETNFATGLTSSASSDFLLHGIGCCWASDQTNDIMQESGSSDASQIRNNWSTGPTIESFAPKPAEDHREDSSPMSACTNQIIDLHLQTSHAYANLHEISPYPSSSTGKRPLLEQQPPLFDGRPDLPEAADYFSHLVSSTSDGKLPSMLNPSISSLSQPYWDSSLSALDDIQVGILASPHPSLSGSSADDEKLKCSTLFAKVSGSTEKKVNGEPAPKRPRLETPSPLPTFKVRKEKLGDRITALQQLVSPFGKTDTASVLHEAVEYIKFLHDQVNALSAPYLKDDGTDHRTLKNTEGPQEESMDLRSRGLCLAPISSAFPITNCHIPGEFWAPTFGGSFM
ncbi:hypothetical protein SAY86_011112 [Trapa natans]|uniref:BHLH domain-containing protein n=1 Tax=Trapa natans TaxID=22666 RepID=A0AAN7R0K2_TRANT|nr:hypothetical protein SAY86_011112 [Trapa natans]